MSYAIIRVVAFQEVVKIAVQIYYRRLGNLWVSRSSYYTSTLYVSFRLPDIRKTNGLEFFYFYTCQAETILQGTPHHTLYLGWAYPETIILMPALPPTDPVQGQERSETHENMTQPVNNWALH
jgi:hypothetical protein